MTTTVAPIPAISLKDAAEQIIEYFSRPDAVLAGERNDDYELSVTCWYRKDNDPTSEVRCGVGVLIPDEHYSPTMEGSSIDWLFTLDHSKEKFAEWRNVPLLRNFLGDVQDAHDETVRSAGDPGDVALAVKRIALDYNIQLND